MKKNLKKVISAVIALSVSVSSIAMAATKEFTDVASTANYAQAVNTLAALGVIAGYEDGTFKPENNITRAEVSTMVVAALNRSQDAAGAKGTTKFPDMNNEAKAWATGFVNIGVSEGFISGYDDGTFKPDNNVTYAEIVSMLVRVAGYGRYAEYLGGWPNGYLSVGNDKGITKGVSGAQDAAVSRADVAMLIYNTLLEVPIVESTTLTTDSNGNLVPEMTIMDGKGDREYKTLLTQKHNAYYVEGYVSKTHRSDPSIDADEVEFTIEYTENYDDSDIVVKRNSTGTSPTDTIYVGDTVAASHLFTYSNAIVKIDEDGDPTFVSFIPSGKNKIETFSATLVDDADAEIKVASNGYVKFYANKDASKSTKYNLTDISKVKFLVNGVEVTTDTLDANFEKYVVKNQSGTVQLIDQYTNASRADGKYDIISVTYYGTAKVSGVTLSTGRIAFEDHDKLASSLTLDPEDDDLVYDIYYNGEKVALSAIQTGDVLSVAYDVTEPTPSDSEFFEIHISRDTAVGKFTGKNDDDKEVIVGGKAYEFVQGWDAMKNELNLSDEYTLSLDAFGRIFAYELLTSSAKLAIIDKYSKAPSDDYNRALLYTVDGSVKNLEVDTSKVTFNGKTGTAVNAELDSFVYTSTGKKQPIEKRVVEYKISTTTGRIISLTEAGKGREELNASFRASSNSLGSIKLTDATKVIDAIDYTADLAKNKIPTYSQLSLSSVAGFADGNSYTAYSFGTRNTDGTYPLVIVTDGSGNYNAETVLAVVTKTPNEIDKDGESVYSIEALSSDADGRAAAVTLYANDDVEVNGLNLKDGDDKPITATPLNLNKGDVIVFVKDGTGNLKQIDVLTTAATVGTAADNDRYNTILSKALAGPLAITIPSDNVNWSTEWSEYEAQAKLQTAEAYVSNKDIVQFVYGPIVDKKASYFSIASVGTTAKDATYTDNKGVSVPYSEKKYTNKNTEAKATVPGVLEVAVSSATRVYVLDLTKTNERTNMSAGLASDIMNTSIANSDLYNSGDIIPWDNIKSSVAVNFAFAKVVRGDATDVYVIIGKI